MNKINLVLLGEQKCGTTALKYNLNKHPDINFIIREMHSFDSNRDPLILYNKLINNGKKYNGEGTPIYFYQTDCIEKIHKYNPNMKYLVILRDPIKRFLSSYNMFKEKGLEKRTLEKAFEDNISDYKNNVVLSTKFIDGSMKHYLQRGFYIDQLRHILNFIPKESLHIIISEHLWENPQTEMNKITDFLNLNELLMDSYEKKNVGLYKNDKDLSEIELKLKSIYEAKNKELEDFLEIKLPWII